MKNLANCTPREFLVQTNKIRKSVANWLTLTGIMEIRKNLPDIAPDASIADRRKAIQDQQIKNAYAILDAILDEHPEETAELLGLLCFIEPKDLDKHTMAEILGNFDEIINCPEVISFFTSLMRLGRLNISSTPAASA